MNRLLNFLPRLWANWLSLLGSVLTTISAFAIITFFAIETVSNGRNIYASTLLVVALPTIFVVGLLLIPIGLWVNRRSHKPVTAVEVSLIRTLQEAFADRSIQGRIAFVVGATFVNVLLFSVAGTKAVHYLDSPSFCGTTCHTVMQPEWEGYVRSPHSRVPCVQCHIGPGASFAVKAKLNGMKQVWGVLTNSHSRPVPSPVEHLRPSRDTCEQCHWPSKFTGNRVKIFPHYKDDKDNTPSFNVELLRIGGQNPTTKKFEGIHYHVAQNIEIQYEYRNRERTEIGDITVTEDGKVTRVYKAPGPPVMALGQRTMDCIDCHNRPTHVYDLGPKEAIDRAMWEGRLDPKLPYLVEISRALLVNKEVTRDGAEAFFRKGLTDAYAAKTDVDPQPTAEQLDKAARGLALAFIQNVFPEMKVGWRTYRSHLGHEGEEKEVLGCYRCHDKAHVATLPDGTTKLMGQKCDFCHEPLAQEENPADFDETLQTFIPSASE